MAVAVLLLRRIEPGREVVVCAARGLTAGHQVLQVEVPVGTYEPMALPQGCLRIGGDVPVVVITAFGDDETHQIAYQNGAVAVFDKPFDLDALRTIVLHALRRTGDIPRTPEVPDPPR